MHQESARPLSRLRLGVLALFGLVAFFGLIALGIWQVQRLAWKKDLITRVERQLDSPPMPAPGPDTWITIGTDDVYRRIELQGRFDHAREACTQAVTALGPGCWVLTPLQTDAGWWLLVNRGFIELAQRSSIARPEDNVRISGLLRLSEPGGGFLRRNDPAEDRWYSRDVVAIAHSRELRADQVAPYFIDAADSDPGGPVGGLTVVRFQNNHLVYALTWFALAALIPLATALILRRERQLRADMQPE